ncbi:MG2 domain-containing protein [Mucilaginibacter flavidus]|uniref:MG2 domain-containing protein n=1 Tax=Mucilaginibacter flavidus TaxID=2949309 RepID=UPI0020939892|nr:MG2 domain-containing protein [Mucilaginibacter flavidus]MCO5947478.1 MG2 domain-containing protein [Mucilaginibacter flavidus]
MSLSFTKIVRCLLLASLLLCFTISNAQDKYAKLSLRIDSLANIGLPKSALKEVDKLDALARADNNTAQQVRAVIYRMSFQSYLEENALIAIITRLKADIDKAEFPVKPVLQSLLAQMYWEYYKENRYRFGQRTKLEKQDVDFRNWGIQTVISETSRMYALSLQDVVKEQNTSVGVLDGVLEGDKETRYLRPTLYDLLVHRAFDFYLSDEAAINKPRLPFILNDPRLFSDNRAFAGLVIKTTDTASTLYKGIKYLQQATLFHLEKNNREALADIDIKRLGVLFRQSSVADKDSLYIKALRRVADNFSTSPISADALVLIGTYYKDQDSLTTAYSYFKKAVTMYPKSRGGETAAASIINIRQPTLSVSVENVNVPGKPLLGLVSYSNVKEAKVSIYYLSPAQIQQLTGKSSLIDQFYLGAADKIIKFLKPLRPVQERRLLLPGINDYRKHSAEFKIDSLPVGRYVTVISNVQSKSRYLSQSTNFRITGLSYVARALPGGQTELRIVNRDSGAPLQGVKVVIYRSDYVKNKNVKNVAFSGLSDINGRYLFKGKNGEQYNFILSYKNDNYVEEERDFYNSETIETSSKPVISTILFTDRQLYRSGQTIYFKGLHITTTDGKNAIVPGEDVKVSLQDMNNKLLTELTLKSNEFGSVQGSFVIPQNIANGQVSIVAVNGRAFVRVEEYKRPTFQVTFSPVNALYRPGDSVKIKGRVMAFSGYGISNAKVAYHVTSRLMPVYDERYTKSRNIGSVWSRNGEVAADTIQTNDKGEFETRFKALGDTVTAAARAFDYSDIYMVNADVTDASGETQTAATSIIISSKVLDIDVAVPAKWSAKDSVAIPVRLNNANGQPQKGTVTIKIFALKQPQQFTKDRVWQYPDQFMLTRDEFKKTFPAYPWKQETDPAGLEVLNKLSEVNITADSTMGMLDLGILKNQVNGVYKIVISARSDNGDTTSMTKFVKVVNGPTPVCDTEDWQLFTTVKPGESLEYLIGTDKPSHVLMEKFDGARLLSSEWITLSGPYQQTIKVPVPATNQNSFGVQFLTVSDNRMRIFYNQIKMRDTVKKLPIRFITFRNKLQPGEKEQWKLQITGADEKNAAEMLGALYDASLDDIAPAQYWQTDYGYYLPYTRDYFIWIRTQLAEETTAEWIDRDDDTKGYSLNINYEQLNLFGYDYFGGDNGGYTTYLEQVKENLATLKADKKLATEYFKNAALVKGGYDVSGKTIFNRQTLPGVKISIKNTGISTRSNSKGYFKIKVPVNGVLVFNSPPFPKREIKTKAAAQLTVQMAHGGKGPVLEELKIADPGVKSLKGDNNAVMAVAAPMYSVSANAVRFPPPVVKADMEVKGYMAKSNSSKGMAYDEILGNVSTREIRAKLDEKDKSSVSIIPRKNFNETAFFYPQLHTDEKGQILIDFTIPEALTRWKFRGFAHNKDLQTGYVENEVIT